jgi:carbon monoxide dehydrogenase subunit G
LRIEERIEVAATPDAVWDYVTDPANYTEFMDGVTRWEVQGRTKRGLGARYRMLIQVGSAEVGGLIEVVEWKPSRNMAWSSVTGVDQRGRWMLRDAGEGRTRVTFRFAYGVAGGGLAGLVAERVAARPLRRRFRQALTNLKGAVEGRRIEAEAGGRAKLAT